MMLWLPVILLLAALGLSEVLRQFGRPATGLLGLLLSLAFAVGLVGLVLVVIGSLEIDSAERALEWARGWVGSRPGVVTAALACAGFALAMVGATRLVDRVALADPDGPLPETFAPGLVCALGALLVLAAFLRV